MAPPPARTGPHAHYINATWHQDHGPSLTRLSPATGELTWHAPQADRSTVDMAFQAAANALPHWASLSPESRRERLARLAAAYQENAGALQAAITAETGKPRWEAATEVAAMVAKVEITFSAYDERCREKEASQGEQVARARYAPIGVLAVLGPFNLPGHLPNGHIVPALLAGNTIVFKPSERTPLVGQVMAECFAAAGLPPGVINVVQGARETGMAITEHPRLDGLLFTGSYTTGRALSRALADRPEVLLALEMGGNNPLLVHNVRDLDAAAYITVVSAYITAGQRCTCARRLILVEGDEAADLLDRLAAIIPQLHVDLPHAEPEPFCGPVIDDQAAEDLLAAQQRLLDHGGRAIVLMHRPNPQSSCLLRPGLVDVTDIAQRDDAEIFGPLLQVVRVPDLEAALAEANRTRFGLAASLLSDDAARYERFRREVRAGCINWNQPTTGASSKLPFGGVGRSGNHRPAGYFSIDYCCDPIASLEARSLHIPSKRLPGMPL